MQTRIESFLEANVNTGIGLIINLSASFAFYPLIGWGNPVDDWWKYCLSTAFFTVLSVARSYLVRRYFNKKKGPPDLRLIVRDQEEVNHG